MFENRLRKYFRYAKMTSFIFETIIEFSAAIRNVYAQLVLMSRRLTSTYIMLIWMLLWHPLTYLFHEEQEFYSFEFFVPFPTEQLCGANTNEIKHDNPHVVIVVLDPRYDQSYNAMYTYSHSIALML